VGDRSLRLLAIRSICLLIDSGSCLVVDGRGRLVDDGKRKDAAGQKKGAGKCHDPGGPEHEVVLFHRSTLAARCPTPGHNNTLSGRLCPAASSGNSGNSAV